MHLELGCGQVVVLEELSATENGFTLIIKKSKWLSILILVWRNPDYDLLCD